MVSLLRRAADDAASKGVVVRLREAPLSITQAEELGREIRRVRAAGKKVHVFTDFYGPAEIVLGAHADEVIIQEGGAVSLPGLYMEELFLADALEWVGVKAELVQVGAYKGANESMTRPGPSPEWDQNINALLDGMYANLRTRIRAGRRLNDAQIDEAMRAAWMADGPTARRVGLLDASIDLPDLSDHLARGYGASGVSWVNIEHEAGAAAPDMSNPFAAIGALFQEPEIYPERDTIAVVHIDGPIIDGESTQGGLFGESGVGSTTIRRILEELKSDDLIKGIVIRINSPGGSATASEIIWQGLHRVSKEKPVWASVGDMAASGGYYVAVGSQRIYANESSVLGSIGVVGGKVAMTGLYDKLRVRSVGRARGPMGHILGSSAPWTDAERELVRAKMKETYDLFASRVSAGRPGMDLSRTAEGRLFTGADAVGHKMADKVGGLQDAVADMAAHLNLADGAYDVLEYPGPASLLDVIGGALGAAAPGSVQAGRDDPALSPLVAAGRALVGERHWPAVRDHLGALMQLRDRPVLLVSPRAVIVK
ncbi:MAG: S49 family peptidase [Phycisphaeraceae bacterium]|nr:S49 family peptidase [Phycisphaeraceae bacterium]